MESKRKSRTSRPWIPLQETSNLNTRKSGPEQELPVFEVKVTITVSARNKEEAERLVDSRLIRLESDVILKTERTETREVSQ